MRVFGGIASFAVAGLILAIPARASLGDRLPAFKECLESCQSVNCDVNATPIPFHHRLLLWDCPAECDYNCQHIVTEQRVARFRSELNPVHQFHGKWPFYRFLGMQEPFSVLFSFLNFLAHYWGMSQIRAKISPSYPLRSYYIILGYVGFVSWTASMVFHTRDFMVTERADYFAAGANVLYGLYYAPIRIFRMDNPNGSNPAKSSLLHLWTITCVLLYVAHVSYLSFWRWDYTYNMGANIAVGIVANVLWTSFALKRYNQSGRLWQSWPGMIVAWIILAMSMEILDFVPFGLMVDAHSLWHLGTVGPTIWWYRFLVKDAIEDMQSTRLKA